jgi:hypothetical protein
MAKCSTANLPARGNLPVSQVRNANEFLLRFREIQERYENIFSPCIQQLRVIYTGNPGKSFLDQNLEAHARAYIVNAFLASLNWRLDQNPEEGLPNLIPEAPVQSKQSGNTRFLDYLGLEGQTYNPLMIVETKRPSAELPYASSPAATYSEVICRGLSGECLYGDWNKWLDDLKDYFQSTCARTQKVPKRIVITNGDWMIIFLDPSNAFQQNECPDPIHILVFTSRSDIERNYYKLFTNLEYIQVSGEIPPLTPGELLSYVDSTKVVRAMHGLRLLYIKQPDLYRRCVPVIKVASVVFIQSRYGGWLRVERPFQEHELPKRSDQLLQHLKEVNQAATDLLTEINKFLGTSFQPIPLLQYYEEEFISVHGVAECRENEYLIITGDKTHYLLLTPSIHDCPFHDWNACYRPGKAYNQPIKERSTSPRSFFYSTEIHHCAHNDVSSMKATMITDTNRSRCGPRSGLDGQAFCEIWSFEQYLCCRACVFEKVCTKATIFQLPC